MPGLVLMAVYQPDALLLRRQVESLQRQVHDDWTCLMGVDGPDPSTRALLEDAIGDDSRFRVVEYAARAGHYRNFERLTQAVPQDVEWVAYCDQDDSWYPQKLQRLVTRLRASPTSYAVVGAARVVDRDGRELGHSRRRPASCAQLLLRNEVTGSFAVFRREVLDLAQPFPVATPASVHDHWLGVCASALGGVEFLGEVLQDYVQHPGNVLGEVRGSRLGTLVRRAAPRGGGPGRFSAVARERWGWRVSMARALLDRLDHDRLGHDRLAHDRRIRDAELEAVRVVADGRPRLPVARLLARETRGGHLSVLGGMAMLGAALWWRDDETAPQRVSTQRRRR